MELRRIRTHHALALHLAVAMGTARQILYQPPLGIEGASQVSERPSVWNTLPLP
ncbi:Uncharacterized protein DAT39_006675 [Clarias magur]|uniref:Uncharacterized protein n=1 Tax=Clarias magur TaxID=1594786 RepID=A0A8J4XD09_CLAMG|nr:Uncharacterized protein DAT39_006675 [Clarias magur]